MKKKIYIYSPTESPGNRIPRKDFKNNCGKYALKKYRRGRIPAYNLNQFKKDSILKNKGTENKWVQK